MEENYLDSIRKQFQYYQHLGDQTFAQLAEADIFWKHDPYCNSIAIIVKHLRGNMLSRWTNFLSSDGEKEWRNRDSEFIEDIKDKADLLAKWQEGWACLFQALDSINKDNFETTIYIRNMGHTIPEAINRQLAHYAYHVGQIVFIGTMIKGEEWKSLSIPKGQSMAYNKEKFAQPKRQEHFTKEFLPDSQNDRIEIKNLANTSLATIVDCLLVAFEGYFVQMPSDVKYWESRYKGARVDYSLSFGAFHKDKLVAFIINGVDKSNGVLTAFNTGTGVIPAFRGQQLVDKIYAHAIPILKNKGVQQCSLEVIQANARAIRVYERIGFKIDRSLKCFKGTIDNPVDKVSVQKVDYATLVAAGKPEHDFYSWDHSKEAILKSGLDYQTYKVNREEKTIGYFSIKESGYLGQFEAAEQNFHFLMNGVKLVNPAIRINNVDARRTTLVNNLLSVGLENTIDQFEMSMGISD